MPPSLRGDPAWIYWYGRALKAESRPAEAQDHFAQIAPQFNFYGKLAAEELGIPIVLPPRAPAPTAEEHRADGRATPASLARRSSTNSACASRATGSGTGSCAA